MECYWHHYAVLSRVSLPQSLSLSPYLPRFNLMYNALRNLGFPPFIMAPFFFRLKLFQALANIYQKQQKTKLSTKSYRIVAKRIATPPFIAECHQVQ